MTATAVVVDYGSGNLHSAGKALERAAREAELPTRVVVSSDPADVRLADRVLLPGVGAFSDCYNGLAAVEGMLEALHESVDVRARPFMGICVGMQLMATRGLEFGDHAGLDWIAGEVMAISPTDPMLKIPHMGWNTLSAAGRAGPHARIDHPVFDGISTGPDGEHAYFVHSFHYVPTDQHHVLAQTDYGGPITAAIGRDNMLGTQFHPEKSQALGLRLLGNFLRWMP